MCDWKDDILVETLDCGYGDLSVLEDCKYDMRSIIDECKSQFGNIELNNLAMTMFDFGRRDIDEKRQELIDELTDEKNEWDKAIERGQELTDEEQERYDALESDIDLLEEFDPFETIKSYHNFIDTSIWLSGTSDDDRLCELLKDAFDEFEENTGYTIG